jgi:hypothetical protein
VRDRPSALLVTTLLSRTVPSERRSAKVLVLLPSALRTLIKV